MIVPFKVTLGDQVVRWGLCQENIVEAQATETDEVSTQITLDEFEALSAPPAPPPVTVDSLRAELLALAASRRWEIETGGTTFAGGAAIETDDRSKLLIVGAAARAKQDAEFETRWKTPSGWVDLDAETIIAIHDEVFAHVNTCFAREAELVGSITAAETIEDLEALRPVILAFWPET